MKIFNYPANIAVSGEIRQKIDRLIEWAVSTELKMTEWKTV